jgi:hypothetical protein
MTNAPFLCKIKIEVTNHFSINEEADPECVQGITPPIA